MATIRIVRLVTDISEEGLCPIYLRVSDRQGREHFFTGFYTNRQNENKFDDSKDGSLFAQGRGVSYLVDYKNESGKWEQMKNKDANEALSEMLKRAKAILDRYNAGHISWTMDMFREEFQNKPKRNTFLDYANDIIKTEYRDKGHYKQADILEDAINSLSKFDPHLNKRLFQDINAAYIGKYVDHCKSSGNKPNTISIRLRAIRRTLNLAIRDGIGCKDSYPFSKDNDSNKVSIPQTEINKADQYLTLDSLKKLANTTFDNYVLERTKHLFLFSLHTRGMNWKDMALLTDSNFYSATVVDEETLEESEVTMIGYGRSKTKTKYDIQVTPAIQEELNWFKENSVLYGEYVLPIISKDIKPENLDDYLRQVRKRFNASLKQIATALELPESQRNITIYSARHSFAMSMRSNGKDIELISQALGHKSLSTTKHYLEKFSTTKMAKETSLDLSL